MTSFSKNTFTVPTETWAQLKKLTGDKTGRGFAPLLSTPGVRFSRDRYISDLLERELPRLEDLPVNSEAAYRELATEARNLRQSDPDAYAKVNVNFAAEVSVRLTKFSRDKRIPRDLVMTRFLELVVSGLFRAQEMATDPIEAAWFVDEEPYRDLYLSDDDLAERKESGLLVYALGTLKSVPLYEAEKAYWRLPRSKRRAIRNRPDVRAAMKRLRKDWKRMQETPIDLSDLIDESTRPRRSR